MNDDKNCDCADGFANAIWGPIALVALIIHPFLSIGVLILWAVATAWPDRSRQTLAPALSDAQQLEQAERAAARLAQEAERAKEHRRAAVALAAIAAAAITAEVIAILIGRVSHSDPADVFPWVVSGGILTFVVVWAKFYRQEVAQ